MQTVPREELGLAFDRPTDENPSCGDDTASRRFDSLLQVHPVDSIQSLTTLDEDVCCVGRERSCQLRIQDRSVSRQHAVIRLTENGWLLTDLGSTNGTKVNDTLATNILLKQGDRIQFGKFVFKYLCSRHVEQQYHDAVAVRIQRDDLLNVMNKRAFLERFARSYQQAVHQGTQLTVVMLDLDHFKEVNDRFGHQVGDDVLQECVSRIQSVIPTEVTFARYGGEEFVLMFEGFGVGQAMPFAEEIRSSVGSVPFQTTTARIATTVSLGIADISQIDAHRRQDGSELINLADTRLYLAKEDGRNRIGR